MKLASRYMLSLILGVLLVGTANAITVEVRKEPAPKVEHGERVVYKWIISYSRQGVPDAFEWSAVRESEASAREHVRELQAWSQRITSKFWKLHTIRVVGQPSVRGPGQKKETPPDDTPPEQGSKPGSGHKDKLKADDTGSDDSEDNGASVKKDRPGDDQGTSQTSAIGQESDDFAEPYDPNVRTIRDPATGARYQAPANATYRVEVWKRVNGEWISTGRSFEFRSYSNALDYKQLFDRFPNLKGTMREQTNSPIANRQDQAVDDPQEEQRSSQPISTRTIQPAVPRIKGRWENTSGRNDGKDWKRMPYQISSLVFNDDGTVVGKEFRGNSAYSYSGFSGTWKQSGDLIQVWRDTDGAGGEHLRFEGRMSGTRIVGVSNVMDDGNRPRTELSRN